MLLNDAVRSWYQNITTRAKSHGLACASQWVLWHFGWEIPRKLMGKNGFSGRNVFDSDWDLLILLDALRFDLLEEVVDSNRDEYSWLGEPQKVASVSGQSLNWMERTFGGVSQTTLSGTYYISANPFTKALFNIGNPRPTDFLGVEELWKSEWNDDLGTVPPRSVTDRAIDVGREVHPKRLIVHYMQPHFPSIPKPFGSNIQLDDLGWKLSVWQSLKRNEISKKKVWRSYRANLEYVLQDVELLLSNYDANEAVVTSDHGNAMGERGYFGHDNWPVAEIKYVPWCETTATDSGSHEPTTKYSETVETSGSVGIESRLEALGYR